MKRKADKEVGLNGRPICCSHNTMMNTRLAEKKGLSRFLAMVTLQAGLKSVVGISHNFVNGCECFSLTATSLFVACT
jgi:hypothetical protein